LLANRRFDAMTIFSRNADAAATAGHQQHFAIVDA
jgi:hypothetical protein